MWNFIFLLHNLAIHEPFDSEYAAIVPVSDERVSSLISKYGTLKILTERFTNQFKVPQEPSIFIVRDDAPATALHHEALVAFRNILAICAVIESWQNTLAWEHNSRSPNYSNYFDIYPIAPDKFYQDLTTRSPSLRAFSDSPDSFCGQTSPELADLSLNGDYDNELASTLIDKWTERYIRNKSRTWKLIALFRSLEIAYQASSIPFSNNSTIYDWGSRASLWVSAFETLAHPKVKKVKFKHVSELLGNITFPSETMNGKKYRQPSPDNYKKKTGASLIQNLYFQLYNLRNSISHGNPVNNRSFMAFKDPKRKLLLLYAPLLFKVALISHLNINYDLNNYYDWPWEKQRSISNLQKAFLTAAKSQAS